MAWFILLEKKQRRLRILAKGENVPRKTAGFLAGGFSKVLAASAAPP